MTRVSSLLFEDIERLYALRSRSATVECDSGAREFAGAGGVAKTFCLVGGNRVTINLDPSLTPSDLSSFDG